MAPRDSLYWEPTSGQGGGGLTKSTRDLQRLSVEIPRLMQLDLGGEQVSDEVDCSLDAQLTSGYSLVECVRYLEGAVGGELPA